jgi:hypothetical protein
MKLALWVLLGFVVTGLAFWMVTIPQVPRDPFFMFLIVAVFAAPPIGAFWMMYMSIRYEKHPLPTILLAFIPYCFLWYYFERVRPGKHLSRNSEIST